MRPLEGIRVLDFTHVISGPYCSMLLGDMGAEVIKIEKPVGGEFYREEGMKNANGVSIVYPNYNRNKKGITLNIKSPKAQEILKSLIKESDVFVENQRPGLLGKMGLGYEDFKKINPSIIYASISGYGQGGPYAKKPAFDMTIAAISGLMSLNGLEGTLPTKTGVAFSDFISGIYCALGIAGAIRKREKTGEGSYIDIGMLDSIISVLDAFIPQTKLTGKEPVRYGNRRAGFAPATVFGVSDGYIYIAGSFQTQWEELAKLMGQPELINDPRFLTNTDRKNNEPALEAIVEAWTSVRTTTEAIGLLEGAGIPCAPVKSVQQVMDDEHVKARKSITTFDYPGIGEYPMAATPVRFVGEEPVVVRAPLLGEHTAEILEQILKYSPSEVEALKQEKVI